MMTPILPPEGGSHEDPISLATTLLQTKLAVENASFNSIYIYIE